MKKTIKTLTDFISVTEIREKKGIISTSRMINPYKEIISIEEHQGLVPVSFNGKISYGGKSGTVLTDPLSCLNIL